MLILPPFQGMGIGATVIDTIYKKFNCDPKVVDITVEDPSDDFRRVRNFVDAKLCMTLPEFAPEKLKAGFTQDMVDAAKNKFKINPKQCRIVYEILRLKATNVFDAEEYKAYRLCVKKRLNIPHHKQKEDLKKMEKRGVDVSATAATVPTTEERIAQLKEEYQVYYTSLMRRSLWKFQFTKWLILLSQAHEEEYYRIINRLESQQAH